MIFAVYFTETNPQRNEHKLKFRNTPNEIKKIRGL
jgi:hypothetical protein